MSYLDSSKFETLLATKFAVSREARLMGVGRRVDSGYYDIVRFFGQRAVDPKNVTLRYSAVPFAFVDPLIERYAEDVQMRMIWEGRLHEGPPVMRLDAADWSSGSPSLTVGPVHYGLQAATCFALDLPHELFEDQGGTLRDYLYHKYDMAKAENNPLPICLGVCGCLVVHDEGKRYLLQVTRSGRLTSLEDTVGPSAAGVVDFIEGWSNLLELAERAMGDEVREELNLGEREYSLTQLAWGMELFRGHRPQVFCLITTPLSRGEVTRRLEKIAEEDREFSDYRFAPIEDGMLTEEDFAALNPEARANWLLVEEYLSL